MNNLINLDRYLGQTVTVFTTSGGCSGSGFSGVLLSASDCAIRLLVSGGMPPSCPIGSSCGGGSNYNGYNRGYNRGYNNNYSSCNPLGSIVIIPKCSIAAFTHNAI